VEIETQSGVETINVEEGDNILQTALDQGIELSHDCKMGVCMTCPARLVRLNSLKSQGKLCKEGQKLGAAKQKIHPIVVVGAALLSCTHYGAQVSGEVDQSAGMLDETAKEKGYALMCVAEPLTDCRIRVIEEVWSSCNKHKNVMMPCNMKACMSFEHVWMREGAVLHFTKLVIHSHVTLAHCAGRDIGRGPVLIRECRIVGDLILQRPGTGSWFVYRT